MASSRQPVNGESLVEITVLFRRLLGCTLTTYTLVAVEQAASRGLPDRPLLDCATGFVALVVSGMAAATAAALARAVGYAPAWQLGLAAFFPCQNLFVLALFGAWVVPRWTAVGETPLLLLLSRGALEVRLEARAAPGPAPEPSPAAGLGTLACVFAVILLLTPLATMRVQPPAPPAPSPRPTPDTRLFAPFAAQGRAALGEAGRRLDAEGDADGLGNTPEAVTAARQASRDLEHDAIRDFDGRGPGRPALAGLRFRVLVHARPERACFLVRASRWNELGDDARLRMLDTAWDVARRGARGLRLAGIRLLVVGVGGGASWEAVTWDGLLEDLGRARSLGRPADTQPLAACFADSRLPVPVPAPVPGSVAARLLEQRRRAPLRETAEWVALVGRRQGLPSQDDRARWAAFRVHLSAADVGELVQTLATPLPDDETRTVLSLLGSLATDYDARITPEQERRLAEVLRSHALEDAPTAVWREPDTRRLWARLDRAFVEDAFRRRLGETGLDRDLWSLLVETRQYADRTRWAETLETLVRTQLRRGQGAGDAVYHWLDADAGAAERVVLEELEPRGLPPEARSWLASAILVIAMKRDRADVGGTRLAAIASLGGSAAARARLGRELLGLEPQDRIERLAREWRESRTSRALSKFYDAYVEKLPVGAPLDRWLELLGVPDSERIARTSFHIKPKDSETTLFLEIDHERRLLAISYD